MPRRRNLATIFMRHLQLGENRHARAQWDATVLKDFLHFLEAACDVNRIAERTPVNAHLSLVRCEPALVGLQFDADDLSISTEHNHEIRQAWLDAAPLALAAVARRELRGVIQSAPPGALRVKHDLQHMRHGNLEIVLTHGPPSPCVRCSTGDRETLVEWLTLPFC